jgi:transposase
MKGKQLGPTKSLYRRLYAISRCKTNIQVLKIDEFLTSQTCATCHSRTLTNLREPKDSANFGRKVHAVRICKTCGTVWNRDEMAAKNILYIFKYMALNNNIRPPIFARPTKSEKKATKKEKSRIAISQQCRR